MTYRPEVLAIEDTKPSVEEQEPPPVPVDNNVVSDSEPAPPPPPPSHNNFETGDLLVGFWILKVYGFLRFIFLIVSLLQGLNDTAPDASLIEERNALALAIVPTETGEFCLYLLLKGSAA